MLWFCTCYLLSPMQQVLYFRFCGWRREWSMWNRRSCTYQQVVSAVFTYWHTPPIARRGRSLLFSIALFPKSKRTLSLCLNNSVKTYSSCHSLPAVNLIPISEMHFYAVLCIYKMFQIRILTLKPEAHILVLWWVLAAVCRRRLAKNQMKSINAETNDNMPKTLWTAWQLKT